MDLGDVDRFLAETGYDGKANKGGMGAPDMCSLYTLLRRIKPAVVIESGVHKGVGTLMIRKAIGPEGLILCLDPRDVPHVDPNPRTVYLTGKSRFVDFGKLQTRGYDPEHTLLLIDDHCDQEARLKQAKAKGLKHVLFNDNYLKGDRGSHRSFDNAAESTQALAAKVVRFPPVVAPTQKIHPDVTPLLARDRVSPKYAVFMAQRDTYRFNTYVLL